MLLAAAVAILHGAVVAFMVSGSLLALRRPRLLWLHVPVSLAILGLYLTGSDCPVTQLELWLRERAGAPGYQGGFIGHYLTEPMGFPIRATSTQVGIYLIAFLPNVIGYGVLLARWLRGRPALLEFFSRTQISAEPREGEQHPTSAPRPAGDGHPAR